MDDATQPCAERLAKVCSACEREFPCAAFNKRSRSPDGLQAWCRTCEHAYAAERRERQKDAELERGRRWRAANPEKARAADKRQYDANPERRRESSRRWRSLNPEKVREGFRVWREANLEHDLERHRQYVRDNPGIARSQVRRRRARKLDNGPCEQFTDAEIGERDGWLCGLCGLPVDRSLRWPDAACLVIDHIVPLALGGTHTRANVQVAHNLCNARKGARLDCWALARGEEQSCRTPLATPASSAAALPS
jgi:5-methylcytosine-specific restriction endonuclease McrA